MVFYLFGEIYENICGCAMLGIWSRICEALTPVPVMWRTAVFLDYCLNQMYLPSRYWITSHFHQLLRFVVCPVKRPPTNRYFNYHINHKAITESRILDFFADFIRKITSLFYNYKIFIFRKLGLWKILWKQCTSSFLTTSYTKGVTLPSRIYWNY